MTKEKNGESYNPISEKDMEEETVCRPKSLNKARSGDLDETHEKLLSDSDKDRANSDIIITDFKNEKHNGDAKLDIGEPKSVFGGMDKEELLKYAKDPFWVRLRWFLFITFWVCWAAMLVGAIMIIYEAPKCEPPAPRTWWQQGPLTQINIKSNLEGLGSMDKNIKGIIVTLWEDAYKKIDESHNVIKLIKEAKNSNKKIILELDPTTSDLWFENSENQPNGNYSDYYIWRRPKIVDGLKHPPNNWIRKNNITCWTYSNKRQHYYYAPFEKPFLNFSNPNVVNEFTDVIKYYISIGVNGIQIRNAPYLFVDSTFEDEQNIAPINGLNLHQYGFYIPTKTQNLPAIGQLLKTWKNVITNLTSDGPLMVREELSKLEAYKVDSKLIVDLPLKTIHLDKSYVDSFVNSVNHTYLIDNIEWPLWKINSTVFPRDALDIITYLLKGTTLVSNNVTVNEELLKTRESPAVMRGTCSVHSINNNTVLVFIRIKSGNPGVLVAFNAMDSKTVVNFPQEIQSLRDLEEATIKMYSSNYNETNFMTIGEKKSAAEIPISPKSAMVLSFVPPKKD